MDQENPSQPGLHCHLFWLPTEFSLWQRARRERQGTTEDFKRARKGQIFTSAQTLTWSQG